MVSGEYTIPNDYTHMTNSNSEYADYCEAPAHVNVDGNLDNFDLNPYLNKPENIRDREIEEGKGPGPEINTEQPQESEIAGGCDPPQEVGIDLNKKTNENEAENDELSVENTNTESVDDNTSDNLPDNNRGAVSGTEHETTLPRGTIGVRYGNPETGEFAAPYDTPVEQLNLPESNTRERHYFVVTDHDEIPVTESMVADDNKQPTGGTQWDFGEGNPISEYDHRHYHNNKTEKQ